MKIIRKAGSTSQILQIFIRDTSAVTGAGLTGLVFNSPGLTAYRHRDVQTSTTTSVTLVTMTVGTYTAGGFAEIDATNMPGWYQFCPNDAGLAVGASSVAYHLKGAANMAPITIEIDLASTLSALPDAAPGAAGGVFIAGSNAATTANITGNITGNLTGSVGSVSGAVGSVTGNVGGNVVGSVASVTAPVTVGTNNDKTGYSLSGTQTFNVTGNITGNLSGSVGSVTAPVTAGTVTDKTGYSLSGTQTFNTTGNITGNLSGSVGSVSGNVGGNVVGSVGSVVGAVGSVTAPVTVGTNNDKTGYSLNLTQAIPTSNAAETLGDALNAARAQGFGKWTLSGTTLTLYAADGSTVVRTFTLDSATAPTSRT